MKDTFVRIYMLVFVMLGCSISFGGASGVLADGGLDISSFALPDAGAGEIWFEQPRDIVRVRVMFSGQAPQDVGLSYRQQHWPAVRLEMMETQKYPFKFGWAPVDDWFTTTWRQAAVKVTSANGQAVWIEFQNLSSESFTDFNPQEQNYDIHYRRTLALKVDTAHPENIKDIAVFTVSPVAQTTLSVRFDIGRESFEKTLRVRGYNSVIETPVLLDRAADMKDRFEVTVSHLRPGHHYSGDDGLVIFDVDDDVFTISLTSLAEEGPIWFADKGIFITDADDPTTAEDYQVRIQNDRTLADRVLNHTSYPQEQNRFEAYIKQPRPHAADYNIGCALASQKFTIENYGDLRMSKRLFRRECVGGKGLSRMKMNMTDAASVKNGARLIFGQTYSRNLDDWRILARFPDPEPVLMYNIYARRRGILLEQKFMAVPVLTSILGQWAYDDPMTAMIRLRFENQSDQPESLEFPLHYSQVYSPPYDTLTLSGNQVLSDFEGKAYLRFTVQTAMQMTADGDHLTLRQVLTPGQSCTAIIKVPFITLEKSEEIQAIESLDFDKACTDVATYWRRQSDRGAAMRTPEPELEALHASHLTHVLMSDFGRPAEPELINTCVGTHCYADYPNESCMIVHDLDERGLHEDARRRLAVWLKYQGTQGLPGNFTDYNGVLQGSGGFEQGDYNQDHGYVMWVLAEHYFLTGDKNWLEEISRNLIDAADWVSRQRQQTMTTQPHSRGWEYGFLPAGSLEDVKDYCYWLSTNALTWRGMERVAGALEDIQHPQAARIRQEADSFKQDLIRGFELSRQYSPLVRLRDGRWVPHYPSRLYLRGRDVGWGRETLEGAVYLLISGLYDANSPQAQWILDDMQDNRLTRPPYGYLIPHFEQEWFSRGGISMQPLLLAGLMPYLDRDEPEIYIWMFYNNFSAVYRQEINAICEHPSPVLGKSGVVFKPSDEANGTAWMRYMFVYTPPSKNLLHLGRAIPRKWFDQTLPFELKDVATRYGVVSIRYQADPAAKRITAEIDFRQRRTPDQWLVRFRTPGKKALRSVRVNNENYPNFDPDSGDVNLTGRSGVLSVTAAYK